MIFTMIVNLFFGTFAHDQIGIGFIFISAFIFKLLSRMLMDGWYMSKKRKREQAKRTTPHIIANLPFSDTNHYKVNMKELRDGHT